MKKQIFTLWCLLFLFPAAGHSQALIALVFGKKLSTDRLELGLFMAAQGSYITASGTSTPNIGFAIGAYTDIKLGNTNKWNLVNYMVFKSPKGGTNLPVSQTLVTNLKDEIEGVSIKRKITYFELTPLFRYALSPSWGIGIGPMVAARTVAKDTYEVPVSTENQTGNLSYVYKISSDINIFDAGLAVDVQYRLMHGRGLRLNLRYTQGFIDIYKSSTGLKGLNSSFHIGVGIPIGAKAKAEDTSASK